MCTATRLTLQQWVDGYRDDYDGDERISRIDEEKLAAQVESHLRAH
jgi:hypothetical protein